MTNRPRLLFYIPALVDGGAERLWATLATEFHARGYPVSFVQDFEAGEAKRYLDPAIPVLTLGRGALASVWALSRSLRNHTPDIALSAVAGSNLKLVLAAWLAGVHTKIVQSVHGEREWKTGVLSFLSTVSLAVTSRVTARTIAVSEGLRQSLIETWGASRTRTVTIENPVALPDPLPRVTAAELQQRPPIVVAAGRLVKDKDFAILLKAFERLDDKTARLVILGKGPEEKALRTLSRQLGLEGRVSLPGYVRKPSDWYQQAACLAVSSSSEAFGNVVVEALAHGLPVVATRTYGPASILTGAALGRLVPVGDVTAMAEALAATLANRGDPELRQARAQDFSITARLPVYERLIEDLAGEGCQSRHTQNVDGGRDDRGVAVK